MGISTENIIRMVDLMPGNHMVYQVDAFQPHCLYYTSGVPALSGHSSAEYAQIKDPFHLIIEEDRIVIEEKIRRCVESGTFEEMDSLYRLFHKEKGFVWVHMIASSMGTVDGQALFVASILDVTKEMLNSYALMEATDRSICVIEKATKRFLYANSSFYDLIDCTPAQAMGRHCYELLCKTLEMRSNDNCLCYSSINAEEPIETYNPAKNKYLTLTGREIVWGEYDSYVFFLKDITAEKHKDALLEDAQKRFNIALDNSDLMIWEYDMVNHLCINSEKAGRDYNIPLIIENYPESLYETGYTPPETVAQIKDVKRRLENGETGFSVERRTVDKFGISNWQKVEYTLECDADGKPIRAIVCGTDISAQKELERKYEEQMEYRNNLAKKALFSIRLDLDEDSISDYTCSEPTLDALAHEAQTASVFLEHFFSTSVFEEGSQVSKERLTLSALKETYSLGQSQYQTTYQCTLLKKYLELNLTIYKNPGNGHLEVFFVVVDVTEIALMHTAFQNVVSKDYDYVAAANLITEKTIFLAKAEVDFMPELSDGTRLDYAAMTTRFVESYRDSFYSHDDFLAASEGMKLETVVEQLQSAPAYEFNYKLRGYDGQVQTYRMSFNYIDLAKTQVMFSRANVTNAVLEEQRNQLALEDALKAAQQADHAKTEFLARMSHDMRTPMNGILGMTRLTQDIPALPDEVQNNLAAIEDSSMFLLRLINDTLDMSKIESNRFTLHPEVVNVGALIQHIISTVRPLANQKQIKLDFVPINAQLEYIRADRVRIQQLFVNVLSNSVKFTPPGGTIRMEVECLKRENGIAYDRISVEDTGCGMSEEFLSHIFEPFTQEQTGIVSGQEGTGLGMAIVKNLVELMGGRIEITSKQGVGTKVTAYINFERIYDVPQDAVPTSSSLAQLNGKRVLLAEDHPLNATIAAQLLEKKGMLVEHFENGALAVNAFDEAEPNHYDVVLMDIRMPQMDGLTASQHIRALHRPDAKTVPIIAMTANAYAEDVQAALAAGMNAHLAKPIEPDVLYEELGKYLSHTEQHSAPHT